MSAEELVLYTPAPLPQITVNVIGGVAVYCDPDTYPNIRNFKCPWKTAIVFHPRHAYRYCHDNQLQSFLSSESVTALGVGLGRTELWTEQNFFSHGQNKLYYLLQVCDRKETLQRT